ncbi:TPA: pirin family protein [Pseudomonas aeruginosa]|nr:pirin family protein [Pseudomonas aeruginosa]
MLLDGIAWHRESLGNISSMRPGKVQWLRAGRRVIHEQRPDNAMRRDSARFHGVQLWLNMPKASKHDEPSYRHLRALEIPVLERTDGKGSTRLIAGHLEDQHGPLVSAGSSIVAHAALAQGSNVVFSSLGAREL